LSGIGPGRVDLVPLGDLALGGRLPHLLEFGDGELLDPVFFGLTTTVSASKATGSSMYLMPALAQSSISFFRIGREAFGDVGLAAAELLETAAGAGNAHGHLDAVLLHLLELFGHRLGNRIDGRRAVDLDQRLGMYSRRGENAGDDGSNLQGFHQQTPLCGAK
jgi:hypothetical protein